MTRKYVTIGAVVEGCVYDDSTHPYAVDTDGVINFSGGMAGVILTLNLQYLREADRDGIYSTTFPASPTNWTSSLTQPDVPRNVSVFVDDGTGWSVDGEAKITGVNQNGAAITETITLTASVGPTTFYGSAAFATISKVEITDVGDITIGSGLEFGYSDKVGLTNYISGETPDIFKLTMDGSDISVPSYDTTYGTLDLSTIPNGADYIVWYRF